MSCLIVNILMKHNCNNGATPIKIDSVLPIYNKFESFEICNLFFQKIKLFIKYFGFEYNFLLINYVISYKIIIMVITNLTFQFPIIQKNYKKFLMLMYVNVI